MALNTRFIDEIEQCLKPRCVCDHIETTGSTYDGLNIDEDDNIQLKVYLIQTVSGSDIVAEKRTDMPGYAWLRFVHGREPSPILDRVLKHWSLLGTLIGKRYLDAAKTVDVIYEELQKCIQESKQMSGKVKFRRIGLILQMEVYPDSWLLSWGCRLYTLNIVPAYTLGEELYESTPINGDEIPDDTMTWHRSFALLEREKLCKGSKMVLRVLKVLSKRDSDFSNFTSYQLKTAVLHETEANRDWSEPMLGRRLVDVLARLERCLTAENLPHFFTPEINLLYKMPSYTMDYLRNRIQRLQSNDIELRQLLQR